MINNRVQSHKQIQEVYMFSFFPDLGGGGQPSFLNFALILLFWAVYMGGLAQYLYDIFKIGGLWVLALRNGGGTLGCRQKLGGWRHFAAKGHQFRTYPPLDVFGTFPNVRWSSNMYTV